MDRAKAVADARVLLGHFVALAANQGPIAAALAEDSRQVIAALGVEEPIPMVLWCPLCGRQHLDMVHASDPGWTNPPHRSHKCAACAHVWRPADVATTGVTVEELATRGSVDDLARTSAPGTTSRRPGSWPSPSGSRSSTTRARSAGSWRWFAR